MAPIRAAAVLDLNLVRVRLATNLEKFAAYAYFSELQGDDDDFEYEVRCIDLGRDPVDVDRLARLADPTTRARRFMLGSYVAHFHGPPAYLVTRGRTFTVFGRDLEKIVWPYFVKHILTLVSADRDYAHLKAAMISHGAGHGTLLVGRHGGGKTVFLAEACAGGARFMANTHVLYRDGMGHGVSSAIRVRGNFGLPANLASELPEHATEGHYLLKPADLFPVGGQTAAPVRNLVIVDYRPDSEGGLRPIAPDIAEAFIWQFSFAVSVYGLQDDLLAHCGYEVDRCATTLDRMRTQLRLLCRTARCFVSTADMRAASSRKEVMNVLDG